MKLRMCLPILFSAAMLAQTPPAMNGQGSSDIQAYLGLTDAQITQLQQLRANTAQTLRPIFQQIQAKETALRQALSAPGVNAATVGQMLLDIQALRPQITQAQQSLNQQAVALLTADQKTKLQTLVTAQQLEPDVRGAVGLGLLAPPANSAMSGMPGFGFRGGPGAFGAGMGDRMGTMRGMRRRPPAPSADQNQ